MNCFNCTHEFKENEGRYNHSDGILCVKCEKNIGEIKLVTDESLFQNNSKFSFLENEQLGKYSVNGELLAKYASVTSDLKFFTTITIGHPDIFIVNNIIRGKELILKELFANVNLPYNLTGVDSNAREFLKLLDEWIRGTIKCTAS